MLVQACGVQNEKDFPITKEIETINLDEKIDKETPSINEAERNYLGKYSVVSLDYRKEWLQRIFVVSNPENLSNQEELKTVICKIATDYIVNQTTSLSFFTEKKYANYHDLIPELNVNEGGNELYTKWRNEFYLGEFNFETMELKTYPVADDENKKRVIEMTPCE